MLARISAVKTDPEELMKNAEKSGLIKYSCHLKIVNHQKKDRLYQELKLRYTFGTNVCVSSCTYIHTFEILRYRFGVGPCIFVFYTVLL